MGSYVLSALALAASAAAPASAATVIIYQDPMTFERVVIVKETPGPDRAFLCILPPSEVGCTPIPVKRGP